MENQHSEKSVNGKHGHAHLQEDIAEAKLAWQAWNSKNPEDWDRAFEIKEHLLKTDPRAWKIAMKEVESSNCLPSVQLSSAPEKQPELPPAKVSPGRSKPVDAQPPTHASSMPVEVVQPGYAPQSRYAPEPPVSPAYDNAYKMPPSEFYGLDLGIVKLGVNNRGSIEAGVNVGIARANVQGGLYNRVEGEFMPYGGPIHARAGAGIGIDRYHGLHSEVGAGANFFNIVNGDADFGAEVNRDISVAGDVRGRVFPLEAKGEAGASVGSYGLDAYTGGNVGIEDAAGVRAGAEVALGSRSRIAAGVGVSGADEVVEFGPDLELNGDTADGIRLHLDERSSYEPTFYPTGDRSLD